jgi:putative cardiolipin synthase
MTVGLICALLLTAGCSSLPRNVERRVTIALDDTSGTTLGRRVASLTAGHTGKTGFRMLSDGLDAFVARAVLANLAEKSIDAQYYLYHDDLLGRLFTYQLIKAADRGVRVRLLVDDMDLSGRDLSVRVLDSHPNVAVRIFNPFSRKSGRLMQFVTRLGKVTRRMHNKLYVVDNQAAILGGRNIGDEYFEAHPDLAFKDLDVLAAGPMARDASKAFDLYWNHKLAYPASVLIEDSPSPERIKDWHERLDDYVAGQADSEYMRALENSELADSIRNRRVRYCFGTAEVIYDLPDKLLHGFDETRYHMSPRITALFNGVSSELIIFSPYFVPGRAGTKLLTGLAARGVRVRVLTNSLASNDVWIVHFGYAKYRKALLRGGVELYELNKELAKELRAKGIKGVRLSTASFHAKPFVFDREQVFVGSLNLDPRALLHNTEIGAVITCPGISEAMGRWFDDNIQDMAFRLELVDTQNGERIRWHGLEDGKQTTFDSEPHVGFWERFRIGLFGLLPIESQL